MKNPKFQFDKEQSKWFVIDAPVEPFTPDTFSGMSFKRYSYLLKKIDEYKEALSKAPRWEVKNQEGAKRLLWNAIVMDVQSDVPVRFKDWEPDPTKLYDLPKNYSVKFEKESKLHSTCEKICSNAGRLIFNEKSGELITSEECNSDECKKGDVVLAILIPEEEVKEAESQEELLDKLLNLVWGKGNKKVLSVFTINRRK